ncbi:MAG TPA: lipase family protein [Candidatus Binatia bacterium]|nr:lipase family protein [Candidatus Binatia bacterium]
MNDAIAYSPKKDDLYYPCKNASFFPTGAPTSDAALCVELSRLAYCECDGSFAFDQARITAELARIGFGLIKCFESLGSKKEGGTHCFLAMRNDKQLAVVAFRGTDKDDPSDLAGDCNAVKVPWERGGKVHDGFRGALAEVRAELEAALHGIHCRTLFTGHSMGAALATLLASLKTPDALYTFGSPLVGDSEFVATLKDVKSFRYVDCCDIVTRVPPEGLGYRHLGQPFYIAQDRSITLDPDEAFINKDRLKAFLEYPMKYESWRKENVGVRELADHTPVNYVSAVTAATPPA